MLGRKMKSLLCQPPAEKRATTSYARICLMMGLLLTATQSFAQKVTMTMKSGSLEKAFQEIEKQTGFSFIYGKNQLSQAAPVNISVKSQELNDVLNTLFSNQPFAFSISGKFIAIRLKNASAAPQQVQDGIIVKGKVTDTKGNPLPAVSVVIPGTPLGAMTNEQGEYFINNAPANAELVLSYISFLPQRVGIRGRAIINVVLEEDVKSLDEAVVIGYGTTTKRMNTGAVSSLTAKDIEKQPISNPLVALPGRVPGLQITQTNGLPGSAVTVQIRGQGSMNSGYVPLYIIDGVPFTNYNGSYPPSDNLNSWGTSGANAGISPFSMINPDDIERMDILKDADATAIYGARGANGVILITTKKGKAGKTKFNANVYTGFGELNRQIPMLNTQQYLELRREAFKNDGVTPTAANAPELTVWDQHAYTDWQDMLVGGTSHTTDGQFQVSGGDAKTHFMFSGGYHKETTVYPGDFNSTRYSGRLTADHTSADNRFYAAVTASYSSDKTVLPGQDLLTLYNLPPNMPLYDATGKLVWSSGFSNPIALLQRRYTNNTGTMLANGNLRYTIIKNLNFKVNLGYTNTGLDQVNPTPASTQNPANNPQSYAYFSNTKLQNYIVEPTLDYSLRAKENQFNFLVGGTYQRSLMQGNYISATNYSSEALMGTLTGAGLLTGSSTYIDYKFASLFGRINYDYRQKYLLNLTFRRDASSRFGPDNIYADFGAVGAAWLFTQEDFVAEALPWLSFGKLRGSYGSTGNDQISNYIYLPLLSSAGTYQGANALYRPVLPNPAVKWETTRKLEAALELGFLKDRIMFTGAYYQNRSNDQLLSAALATQAGYNSYTVNLPALVQNNGVELELNTKNIQQRNFTWTTAFNLTFYKNKLISFPGIEKSFYASSYLVGQPIDVVRRYVYTGYDPNTGIPKYEDVNKDGAIDYNNDRQVIKPGTPYFGGITNNFTYKNWDLSFFLQFHHRKGSTNNISTPIGASRSNYNTSALDRWRAPGDEAFFPAATTTSGSPIYNGYTPYSGSTALWGDASFAKLRNASISYTFPKVWLAKAKISNLRLYAEGQNLFTWAKSKYLFDPETSQAGGAPGLGTGGLAMPPLRTIVFGINCSF
ncbi:TonB-linked outer membrane protein, SusC/RagA family [Chitinophaga jiangningensis]|uniref:TonB-linked outer membrane protein, SusC/RagA family n=1 Tax=Chitinophaga jiangningensis TaxID=1419482 RepID=A0A1M6YTL4_9BACT|nr:TonB-dependent receptor [Chitinophaga jiangningensis]SHL21389.1 TonB-linked outer membrane protein, SusC/RagA family [Chitinophaga jiangningensis]